MDVEKTIEFILSQMADFAVGMQHLREGMQELRQSQAELRESHTELREGLVRVVAVVNQLAVAQREFAQHTEQRFQALTEEVRTIASNLNALIKVVDDLVRRDGQHPQ